jgi:serine/threonine protein kinase
MRVDLQKTAPMGLRTQGWRERTTRVVRRDNHVTCLRDRFELLMPLGSGGFGTVWEGFDMLLERPIAVKELRLDTELTDAGDALREARATARLNHPAIVSLYEVLAEHDRIYMINELVHGHTLSDVIDEGLMSDNDAGRIGYALCEALAHAHKQGVVHRDVKPANVMVQSAWLEGSGGWRVQPAKLMDFGIASIVDPGDHGGHLSEGPHAGSRGYVAPEQEAGHPATPASDVYSLALVLFECFTGAGPGKGRRSRLARTRRDLPAELTYTIDQCLEPDPHLRPDIIELGEVLYTALPELSHQLAAPTFSARVRGFFGGPQVRSDSYSHDRPRIRDPRASTGEFTESTGRLWRVGCAATAAAICLLMQLAMSVEITPFPALIAAGLVLTMPRAGWSLSLVAAIAALAAGGQVGSAIFLVLPALMAILATIVPLPRMVEAALAGAGAFSLVVAAQATSGTALILALPESADAAVDVRQYADVALHTLAGFATAPYLASLGLWAAVGVGVLLLIDRRVRAWEWAAFAAVATAAQIAIGQTLLAPVPAITVVTACAVVAVLVAVAAFSAHRGRVFERESAVRGPADKRVRT